MGSLGSSIRRGRRKGVRVVQCVMMMVKMMLFYFTADREEVGCYTTEKVGNKREREKVKREKVAGLGGGKRPIMIP